MIIAIVLLIEFCIYTVMTRFQINDAQRLNVELVNLMGKSIDEMNEAVKRGLNFITINDDFQETLAETMLLDDALNEANVKLKRLMTDKAMFLDEIEGLYLFDSEQTLRTYYRKKFIQGEPFILFEQMDAKLFSELGNVTGRMVNGKLVYIRTILSMKTLKRLGYLMMVYDETLLKSRIARIAPDQERFLAVYDAYDQIILHNYDDLSLLENVRNQTDIDVQGNSRVISSKYGEMLVAQYESPKSHWRIVSSVAVKRVTRSSVLIQWVVLGVGAASILIWFGMQWWLAQKITGPLNELAKMVGRVDEGGYSMRLQSKTHDELEVLTNAFNRMLSNTDTLVNQVLRGEIRYKEMQMAALQAQINPHMLYNTLECINWLAMLDRKDDIRRVTIAFSKLMKSLMETPRDVTIQEEMDNIQSFLIIYQILLGDRLQYRIDVKSSCNTVLIPRLLIQPIVENAVVHGIKKSLHDGYLYVGVTDEPNGMLISVSDNGIGMSADMVQAINKYGEKNMCTDGMEIGVGYRNVIDRLHVMKGGSISVTSSAEWGTVVDIYLPFNMAEEESEDA